MSARLTSSVTVILFISCFSDNISANVVLIIARVFAEDLFIFLAFILFFTLLLYNSINNVDILTVSSKVCFSFPFFLIILCLVINVNSVEKNFEQC